MSYLPPGASLRWYGRKLDKTDWSEIFHAETMRKYGIDPDAEPPTRVSWVLTDASGYPRGNGALHIPVGESPCSALSQLRRDADVMVEGLWREHDAAFEMFCEDVADID